MCDLQYRVIEGVLQEIVMSERRKTELVLSNSEREQIKALTMHRETAQVLALRARVVLACPEGSDSKTVFGLYLDPPFKAMVLCVDEKSQIQIQSLGRT
jgi:hypothetical protein